MLPRLFALLVASGLALPAADLPAPRPSDTPAPSTTDTLRWRAWGPDLPAVARAAGKPIYVFAGSRLNELTRATLRQSFAVPETAAYLEQHFVCVQVDLDEQAALAAVFRAHLRLVRQAEGLPIHLWLSPDLHLLEVSAYLPPTEEWGKPSFLKVAGQVAEAWRSDPENCGATIADMLAQAAEPATAAPLPAATAAATQSALDQAAASWREQADTANAGFGEAPKHPQPELLRFLLTRPGPDRDLARRTLLRLANSALRDPLDGGFFKYSTDAAWRLPLLQKLLADQARLALAYLDADARESDPSLRAAARGALDYALARLALPAGGFAFAEDGSVDPAQAAYLWSAPDLRAALGDATAAFLARHGAAPDGNLGEELDPGARWKGLNVLVSALPATADDQVQLAAAAALRAHRPAPVRDERAFVGPQALLLAALSRAAAQFDDAGYRAAAERLYHELRTYVSPGPAPTVRRLKGAGEEASPADLAALAFAFRIHGLTTATPAATGLADALLEKLAATCLDSGAGRFTVPLPEPRQGILASSTPAPAEPCEPEALALLAGMAGAPAEQLRAGIVLRLQNEDPAGTGPLLLALATTGD